MSRIETLLELAKEELATAELLLDNVRFRACISRSYYGMYHAAQAALASKNLNSRTYKGVIQLFGQHFIKTGELPLDLAKFLSDAYDLRRLSDYEESCTLTLEQSQTVVDSAREFIERIEQFLASFSG